MLLEIATENVIICCS